MFDKGFANSEGETIRDEEALNPWPLLVVILLCTGIELLLLLSDFGVVGTARLRQIAYEYGGFWPGTGGL